VPVSGAGFWSVCHWHKLSLACDGCQGQLSQQPVTSAARDVIDSAVGMVETAKQLAASPQDQATHHSYSTLSHKLSESIKNLLTAIRLRVSSAFLCRCSLALEGSNVISLHCTHQPVLAGTPGYVRAKFYCPNALVDSNWCIWIKGKKVKEALFV